MNLADALEKQKTAWNRFIYNNERNRQYNKEEQYEHERAVRESLRRQGVEMPAEKYFFTDFWRKEDKREKIMHKIGLREIKP